MIRECPHPDKHPLIEEMTVSPDPESDGVLILDPHLGPKWRLVSTRDPTIVHFPKSVSYILLSKFYYLAPLFRIVSLILPSPFSG